MGFDFRFKSLQMVRKRETDQAKADYAAAQSELNSGLEQLENLYTEVDENFVNTQKARESGGMSSSQLKTHDEFFSGQQIRIERQKDIVRELKQVVEEKHEVLVEKMVEQKAIDRLEEKEKEKYKKALKKKEQIVLDDLVQMRHRVKRSL